MSLKSVGCQSTRGPWSSQDKTPASGAGERGFKSHRARISKDPFGFFRRECEEAILRAVRNLHLEVPVKEVPLDFPPSPELGDLGSSICFELAKKLARPPLEIAEEIAARIQPSEFQLTEEVQAVEPGYINFRINYPKLARIAIKRASTDPEYGLVKADVPERIIVEHTSANPIHPIHIGAARNPILGDALARLLRARGHDVKVHFYINDVGRQVAILAYGYLKLRRRIEGKPDQFLGRVYAITNCLVELKSLNRRVKELEETDPEEARKLKQKLDEWVGIAAELESKWPDLFNELLNAIGPEEDPEAEVSKMIAAYESGELKELVREVCGHCLRGFEQTLSSLGISFDSWDWESELVWSGRVARVVQRLAATPFVKEVKRALELETKEAVEALQLHSLLGIGEGYALPTLTLTRSDGTTLYTTRDIAYTLQKFEQADRVINVVGAEQVLSQLQLKVALCLLGKRELTQRLTHYAYGLVEMPGFKMSSRRGRYITLDEVIEESSKRAYEEVSKRSPHLSEREKRSIARVVGIGAIKFALISVDPARDVLFEWSRVLDFERNSAPFIQYAHARACSIVRKAERLEEADPALLIEPVERDLVLTVAKFPNAFAKAADELRPNLIAEYANSLADKFSTFYEKLPVLKAKPEELRNARLALVKSVKNVLSTCLSLLGIEAPERM